MEEKILNRQLPSCFSEKNSNEFVGIFGAQNSKMCFRHIAQLGVAQASGSYRNL